MVIPIHDRNPTRGPAYVTYAIIAANIVLFLLGPLSGLSDAYGDSPVEQACATDSYFREYAAIPKELVDNDPLDPVRVVVRTDDGQVRCPTEDIDKVPILSVLYAMFLHGGWLHLLGNMLFLFVFGNNVEDRLGHLRYLLFYLGCGYLATYAFALLNASSTEPVLCASGAVAWTWWNNNGLNPCTAARDMTRSQYRSPRNRFRTRSRSARTQSS